MSINFSKERYQTVNETFHQWWNHELERPVFNIVFKGAASDEEKPEGWQDTTLWRYPRIDDVEAFADRAIRDQLYTLSTERYAADAFPLVIADYGTSVSAAFQGCKTLVRYETPWFLPPEEHIDVTKYNLEHHPESWEYRMFKYYFKAASKAFNGRVVLAGPYLYGNIDGLCKFFDGPDMIYNLIDYPDDMKRLLKQNHDMVKGYRKEFYDSISPALPGYSGWGGMFYDRKWSGAQCDFCAMLGPDIFKEFCLPELIEAFKMSPEANYYHLDGTGELVHLDDIMALPNLKCIQWVPGVMSYKTSKPREWENLYRRFAAAGLNIWLLGSIEEVEELADIIGTTKGIFFNGVYPWEKADEIQKWCDKFKVPFNL
jgi:hypothetical protein